MVPCCVLTNSHVVDALHVHLDVCELVNNILLANFAVVLVDHLSHPSKLGPVVLY